MAQRTTRIRFFTGILCVPIHHPAVLASEIATTDILSMGRLELGLGRGHPWLYPRLGLDPEESRPRFEEGMDLLLRIFESERVERFDGRFWQLSRFALSPRPVQKPHPPIFIAAIPGSPSSRLATEKGLGIILSGHVGIPLPALKDAAESYRRALAPGRSPEIILGMLVHVARTKEEARANGVRGLTEQVKLMFQRAGEFVTDHADTQSYASYRGMGKLLGGLLDPGDAQRAVEDASIKHAIVWGTPEEVLERTMRVVQEIRPTRLLLHMNAGGLLHEKVRESMALYAEEVMPKLREES
jgi:alkanesulfonate monooxygenase SsuD/methylene tetrahydromethanopterin reductase-like flavin-dependent oxidoreductase (luciferase family)